MDVAAWQERLSETFSQDGIIGRKLLHVISQERAYGEFVETTYKGHSVLAHSFQEFYIESLQLAASSWQQPERAVTPRTYTEVVLQHMANFRTVRAVDTLFYNGYPMAGFGVLRHLKESALFLAAILSGITTYDALSGWEQSPTQGTPLTQAEYRGMRERRKKEQRRVLGLMIRKESGLPQGQLDELTRWEGFFNEEVHGARLTLFLEEGPAIKGLDTSSVAPKPRPEPCVLFMNRFCEVCWMLLRTLPILQLRGRPFGDAWAEKWGVLDDSFLVMEKALADLGKQIALVIIDLMNAKFPFGPKTVFEDGQQPVRAVFAP